jgi:hypothetical protein
MIQRELSYETNSVERYTKNHNDIFTDFHVPTENIPMARKNDRTTKYGFLVICTPKVIPQAAHIKRYAQHEIMR